MNIINRRFAIPESHCISVRRAQNARWLYLIRGEEKYLFGCGRESSHQRWRWWRWKSNFYFLPHPHPESLFSGHDSSAPIQPRNQLGIPPHEHLADICLCLEPSPPPPIVCLVIYRNPCHPRTRVPEDTQRWGWRRGRELLSDVNTSGCGGRGVRQTDGQMPAGSDTPHVLAAWGSSLGKETQERLNTGWKGTVRASRSQQRLNFPTVLWFF